MTQPTALDPRAFAPRSAFATPATYARLVVGVFALALLVWGLGVCLAGLYAPRVFIGWTWTGPGFCNGWIENTGDTRLENVIVRATVYSTESRAGFVSATAEDVTAPVGTLEPHGRGAIQFLQNYADLHNLRVYRVEKRPEGAYEIPVAFTARLDPIR